MLEKIKIGLFTMIDDDFMIGFRVFWKSFIEHNKWFNFDFLILDSGLSEESKKELQETYEKIKIIQVKKENYLKINMSVTSDILKKTYWKLDIFSHDEYDRLVFLDMDILVRGDIREIFQFTGQIAGCQAYRPRSDRLTQEINSGVFVINKPAISHETYIAILDFTKKGFTMPDQAAINQFFRRKKYLPKVYNVEKRMLHTKRHKETLNNAKIIHYVASKPWQKIKPNAREKTYRELENLWLEYYKK